MELYILFNAAMMAIMFSGVQSPFALLYAIGIAIVSWIVFFVLQGIGLYRMAKNRKLKNKWLAFVPFANLFYMEKLTGPCSVFGQRVKHIGLFTMIAQIVTTMLCVLTIASYIYLCLDNGMPQVDQFSQWNLNDATVLEQVCYKFYNISSYILSIVQLIYELFVFVLCLGLYKKYVPRSHFGLGMLTLFVPLSRYIIIFVLRNRVAIDFEAYIRARQEAFMRSQQQYGGFGNPYANRYNQGNPYNQNPYNQDNASQKPPEEPFSEFGGKTEDKQGGYSNANPFENQNKNESPFEDFE